MACNKGCPDTDCNNWVMTDSDNCYHCGGYDSQAKIKELEQQLAEAKGLLKRCEHKLVYYLSGEPAHELAEAIKEHLK